MGKGPERIERPCRLEVRRLCFDQWSEQHIGFSLHIPTNVQHQSLRRCFRGVDTVRSHATHDGADEVNVEDGEDVDEVEEDGNAEKAQTPEPRHVGVVVLHRTASVQCQTHSRKLNIYSFWRARAFLKTWMDAREPEAFRA